MYIGKKGVHVLKEHVERFEASGQNPWAFFCVDTSFIEEMFGKEAAEWALAKKKKEIALYLSKWEKHEGPIKKICSKKEIELDEVQKDEMPNLQ